jgi:large subunit ribosomal protein L19
MKHPILNAFESKFYRAKPLPSFKAGDTVCVWVKLQEGVEKDGTPKFRLQSFEGTVIRYRKGTTNSTFLVRKISSSGVGVERNFYVHSPLIDHVDVKVYGKVRRSRIYYIRKLRGKAARISSRFVSLEESASLSAASPSSH